MGCLDSKPEILEGREEPNPDNPIATFNCTMGTFKAEIFLDRVPVTASSFIDLCQRGFYNDVHFHRVIPEFMNQFGCPYAKDPKAPKAGTGGPSPSTSFQNLKTSTKLTRTDKGCVRDEHLSKDSNKAGTLSMANTGRPNSGGSQMFINVADNAELDWFSPGQSKHPVFGRVIENYELCVQISKVKTTNDKPDEPIKMISIEISNLKN